MSHFMRSWLLTLLAVFSFSAFAGPNDPLFISLTSGEPHRVTMALNFGKHHNENGHPLSIFLAIKASLLVLNRVLISTPINKKYFKRLLPKGVRSLCAPCV